MTRVQHSRHIHRRLIILCLVLLLPAARVVSQVDPANVVIANARTAGMGGTHIAYPTGFTTLFSNPAALIDVPSQFSLGEFTFRFAGPVFSLGSVVIQGISGDLVTLLSSPDVQSLLSSIYANLSLAGPLYFGYAGPGLGFAVINDTELVFQNVGATRIEARLSERFLLKAGYGIRIPLPESWESTLSVGFGLKGFVRGDVIIGTSLLALPTLIDNLDASLLTGSPFELISGIGADAGVYYQWRELLGVGITANDLYTPTAVVGYDTLDGFINSTVAPGTPVYETLPQDISVGLAFTPVLGSFERYVSDLAVTLDYRDIFDFWIDPANAENLVLKFGLGLEATLLEALSVRAGFSQGLLSAGLGIDMGVLDLNAAMYGTELSAEPGLRPVYNLILGLEFRR